MYTQSILANIESYSQTTPDKIALISGKDVLSYRQLFVRAHTLAIALSSMGLQKERLAVHVPNSIELAVIDLASLMSGVVIVPLSIQLKKSEVMTILSETSPKAFMGNAHSYPLFADYQPSSLKHFFSLHENPPHPFQVIKIGESELKTLPFPQSHCPAAIFYTSGSTNKPKGIVHSERSLTAMMDSVADSLDLIPEDLFLMSEPMSNCSGFTQALLPLFVGATTIIMPLFSIEAFLDAVQHHPTKMSLMGKGNREIIDSPQLTRKHFSGISFNLSGGDRISKELMESFQKKTGIPIRLGYGMSECLVLTGNKSEDPQKRGSVGQCAKNTTIQLRDHQLNPGNEGEVWVKGPNCMLGYWNEPELTAETLVDGWLRTGDLARCDVNGFYWILGRLKQMIIRDGDNISPFEIEDVLMQHPAVHAAGVIGVPHPIEGAVPHAFVELKDGNNATEQELLLFVKQHLEDNKVPADIKIVAQLPRTLSGKIARGKLK